MNAVGHTENNGYIIGGVQNVTPPPDFDKPRECPWESIDACRGCPIKCANKELKINPLQGR